MAQSMQEEYAGQSEPAGAQAAKQKKPTRKAFDSAKRRYLSKLLGEKGVKVKAPKVSSIEETTLGKITTIPKIVRRNMNEIEIQPILKNFSYVRILYDTMANEYFYEAIEPKLLEEESELLEVLKEILVENLEMLEDADKEQKQNYLRRIVDGLLRELGVDLHPVSKERVMYYVYRDFMRYGPIDVVMTDIQVEDVSCDGVNVPFYIYHRKYGSIPSNLKFDNAEELDSFVIWLAQRSGKHISVAKPMLDATIPDGSRLQATLGMHVTKRGSSFTIRRHRVGQDDDAECDPPVHPAPDEDRVHRGHARAELAARELGAPPHARGLRRQVARHGQARRRDRHVRPPDRRPPAATAVHDDR